MTFFISYSLMQRFTVILWALLIAWMWFSFAATPTIINHSYTVEGNEVRIFRTDNSNWWNVDIIVENPETNDRFNFGSTKISEQVFVYPKQREGDQVVWLIPDDGWDEVQLTIPGTTVSPTVSRTAIQAVPKTWPDGHIVWIILATLAIFGGYIYIKKRADI